MAEPLVVTVVGPTATGKTDLAVRLARELDGEIVNADSMQLYAGMDIGTAKPTEDERGGVEHHLLDIWPITKSASVSEYQAMARLAIAAIHDRGRPAVMVGGSGLYVRAAVDRLDFPGESPEIRTRLYAEIAVVGPEVLHARLAQLDPVAAAAILPTNDRRVARALEVIELTGRPFTARMPGFESIYPGFAQLGVDFDDRDTLDERVALRVHRMLDRGFLDEVRALLPAGLRESPTAGKALGYAQLLACMNDDGEIIGDLDEAIESTIRGTRRFVRRQRSWFGRDPRTRWLNAAGPDLLGAALATLQR